MRAIVSKQRTVRSCNLEIGNSSTGRPGGLGSYLMPGITEKSIARGNRSFPSVTATGILASRKAYFTSSKYHLPEAITGTQRDATPLRIFLRTGIVVLTTSA